MRDRAAPAPLAMFAQATLRFAIPSSGHAQGLKSRSSSPAVGALRPGDVVPAAPLPPPAPRRTCLHTLILLDLSLTKASVFHLRDAAPLRRRPVAVRAQEGSGAPPPPQQESSADDERRLEALEAAARARRGVKAEQSGASRSSRPSQVRQELAGGLFGSPDGPRGAVGGFHILVHGTTGCHVALGTDL